MARSSQVQRIFNAAKEFTAAETRSVVFETLKELGNSTPVDTTNARSNYQVGIGIAPQGEVGITSQASMVAKGLAVLRRYKTVDQGEVFLVNNVPYIGVLNAGSSTQAPAGFIDSAITRAIAKAQSQR